MARVNDHYLELKSSYLFSDIAKRVTAFGEAHPGASLIRLGIGDVTRPLPPAVVQALHEAADEMARPETFRGYGPETGLRVPHRADRRARLRRPRRQGRARRDLRQRRRQERHHQHPGDLRRRLHGGPHRSRVPGVRRQQRDGRARRPRRRRRGATIASSTCPRPPRTTSGPRSRAGPSTSSTSAIRTTRRARCSAATASPRGSTTRAATRP